MDPPCGCYYLTPSDDIYYPFPQRHYLPLIQSSVHSTILHTTSRTVLTQRFTNPSQEEAIAECNYTFPLYDGVSVVSFTCRVGETILHGLVREKGRAKEAFDESVARGEAAGLLEQCGEAADVFGMKIGNVAAGETVVVKVTYVGELKGGQGEGATRFTIPTSVAPRYGGSGFGAVGEARVQGGIEIVVDVDVPDGSCIKGVQSPSHPIAVSMGTISTAANADPVMHKASATLALGEAALEKDFVLIVQTTDAGSPKALLETHPTIHNQRAIMATLVPKSSLPPCRPELVFVADRSGSMRDNIPQLKQAMKVFLKSMPTGVKFNICSFGSSHSFLWEQSRAYDQSTLEQASRHLETFDASMGGTDIFGAIKGTFDRRCKDVPLEVMVLTDGDIWNQKELFEYLNQEVGASGGQIRVFTLGIGNGVSHALIEGVARAGNGFSQAVQNGERLDGSVVRMLRGALSAHLTDCTFEVKYGASDGDEFDIIDKITDDMKVLLNDHAPTGKYKIPQLNPTAESEKEGMKLNTPKRLALPAPEYLQAPHKIPTLFPFSRTSVYILLSPETIERNPTAVLFTATSEHGPVELEIPIEVLPEKGQVIHQLAAKKAIQELEEGRGWIFDAKGETGQLISARYPHSFRQLVRNEAIRLGEKFQVAGKWCSFVAVAASVKQVATAAGPSASIDDFDLLSDVVCDALLREKSGSLHVVEVPQGRRSPFQGHADPRLRSFHGSRAGPISSSTRSFRGPERSATAWKGPEDHAAPEPYAAEQVSSPRGTALGDARKAAESNAEAQPPAPPAGLGSPKINWTTTSLVDKLHGLIALQSFNGSWPIDQIPNINEILGKEVGSHPRGGDDSWWITTVLVLFMEMKIAAERDTWALVVEKARGWMASAGGTGLEVEVEVEAEVFVAGL